MANTLNLGGGKWATKEGSLLAYNSENNNYKPLPFTFDRASTATRVNKQGLIETVGADQPRIDYSNDSNGALKLEPSRTNLVTYSEDFSRTYWTKSGATIQGDPSTAGSELVTNGDFATDSDWTKGTGWTISGGTANCDGTNSPLDQFSLTTIGKTYKVEITVSNMTTSSVNVRLGTASSDIIGSISSNGTYTFYGTVANNTTFRIRSSTGFNGSIDNVSVKEVQGFSAPDGTNNAYKLVEDTSVSTFHYTYTSSISVSSTTNNFSVFVKSSGSTKIGLRESSGTGRYATFDLINKSVISQTGTDAKIEELNNGWLRLSFNDITTTSTVMGLFLLNDSYTSGSPSDNPYTGNGTSGIFVFGAQVEQGSYPTSIIKTQGSAVTRLADACNNAGNDQVINSTEGVLYAEISALADDSTNRHITLSDGSNNNRLVLKYDNQSNVIQAFNRVGGVETVFLSASVTDITLFSKCALKYKVNDYALWIDSVEVATDTNATTFPSSTLNDLKFGESGVSSNFYGNVKDVRVYNTALTDQELAALTQE